MSRSERWTWIVDTGGWNPEAFGWDSYTLTGRLLFPANADNIVTICTWCFVSMYFFGFVFTTVCFCAQ